MGDFHTPAASLGRVRVVAFSGLESDAPYGISGAIAAQLGRRDQFKDYAPLSAPGQTAWVNLLQGEPRPHPAGRAAALLRERPIQAHRQVGPFRGDRDGARQPVRRPGQAGASNVCLVTTDLIASYQAGAQQINQALSDLERETGRLAMNLA